MASSKKVAVVVVSWEWAKNLGVRKFFDWPDSDEPRANFIFAPLAGTDDRGVWLKTIKSPTVQRKDGKPAALDLMIPWQAVEMLAVVTEAEAKTRQVIGFKTDAQVTIVGAATDEEG